MCDKKDLTYECKSIDSVTNLFSVSKPSSNLTSLSSDVVHGSNLNRKYQHQKFDSLESSTNVCKSSKLENMIVNPNSIDLTLHSRSTSSEISLKENNISPDKMNIKVF